MRVAVLANRYATARLLSARVNARFETIAFLRTHEHERVHI